MPRKKGLNRLTAEAIEVGFARLVSVRKYILDRDEDYMDATSITAREWEYNSTLCPATNAKKKKKPAEVAVERARALHAAGWRGQRVVIVPKTVPTPAEDFFNRVAPAQHFYEDVGAWLRRVNAVLESFGISVCLAARHAALIAGELRPHLHLLVMRAPDSTLKAAQVREIIAQQLGEVEAVIEPPPPRVAGFINKPKRLREYVTYLHKYPVTYYVKEGVKGDLRDLIDSDRDLFLAALAALTFWKFSLKGSVVLMGPLKVKPASLSQNQTGTIRVELEPVATPGEEPKETEKETAGGVVACSATPPAPRQRQFGVRDPWAKPVRGSRRRKRRKKDPKKPILPLILHIIARPSRHIVGLEETIAHLRGCRGWDRPKIEDYFPLLGEKWRWERYALRMSACGLTDENVIKALAKAKARALERVLKTRPHVLSRSERIDAMVAKGKAARAAAALAAAA